MELDAGQNIITRHLPKTGQETFYSAGDDGFLERGWWIGRLNSNNKTRFVTKTISGDAIVIDRATGLMWPKNFNGNGGYGGGTRTWTQAVSWAFALTFAGFGDWRLPNALEMISIARFEGAAPCVHTIFDNRSSGDFWTSTTRPTSTDQAMLVQFAYPGLGMMLKTLSFRVFAVRDTAL